MLVAPFIWGVFALAILAVLVFAGYCYKRHRLKHTGVDKSTSTGTGKSTDKKTDANTDAKSDADANANTNTNLASSQPPSQDDEPAYKISYVSSHREWSGSSSGTMPLKTLTYKQYECLEDARYGFKIVGVKPTERKNEQPHKTRAHGLKTVASLVRHGFLTPDGSDGHVITDHGLNALETCDVRY